MGAIGAHTIRAAIRALTGERDLAVGIVACLQTHGSRANWHPHIHMIVTDDGFRPDGTFVAWPAHDTARLTEAFRRAVLRLFVRRDLFDEDQAAYSTLEAGARTRRRVSLAGRVERPFGQPLSALAKRSSPP